MSAETRMEDIPVGGCIPDPENRDAKPTTELIDSVAEFGVLEPILVTTNGLMAPGERFLIVAGERRWQAAKAANRKTIPAIIRESMTDRERVETQIVENLHRKDLDPFEEASQLQRLIKLEVPLRDVARTVGMTQALVKDRLQLLALEDDHREMWSNGDWNLQDCVAIGKLLEDDSDEATVVLAQLQEEQWREPGGRNGAKLLRSHYQQEQTMDRIEERLEKAGTRIVARDDYGNDRFDTLRAMHEDEVPTLGKHRKMPCHAVRVGWDRGKEAPMEVPLCTDPKAHGISSRSSRSSGQTDVQRRYNHRTKQRRPFIGEAIDTATKAQVDEMLYRSILSSVADYKITAGIAGIDCKNREEFDKAIDGLSGKRLREVAVAAAASRLEKAVWQHGNSPDGEWWERWLKARGLKYKPMPKAKS